RAPLEYEIERGGGCDNEQIDRFFGVFISEKGCHSIIPLRFGEALGVQELAEDLYPAPELLLQFFPDAGVAKDYAWQGGLGRVEDQHSLRILGARSNNAANYENEQ